MDSLPSSITTQSVKSDSERQLVQLLKQYDLQGVQYATTLPPTPTTTPYRSNDALIASILKEQGLGPSTPRIEAFEQLLGV